MGRRAHCSYVYRGRGMRWPVPRDTPIAYDPRPHHDSGKVSVLFADCTVRSRPLSDLPRLVATAAAARDGSVVAAGVTKVLGRTRWAVKKLIERRTATQGQVMSPPRPTTSRVEPPP